MNPTKEINEEKLSNSVLVESKTFRATVSLRIEENEAVAKLLKELTLRSPTTVEREPSKENNILLCLSSASQTSTPKSIFFFLNALYKLSHRLSFRNCKTNLKDEGVRAK
jgi:hypothetical protein